MKKRKNSSQPGDNTVPEHVDDSREKGYCSGFLIFVVAIIMLIFLSGQEISSFYSGRYVETQAVIKSIDLEPSGYDGRYRRHARRLMIEYIAGGKLLEEKQVLFDETKYYYHEGMQFTMIYNADDPSEMIRPGDKKAFVNIIIMLIFMTLFGGSIVLVTRRKGHVHDEPADPQTEMSDYFRQEDRKNSLLNKIIAVLIIILAVLFIKYQLEERYIHFAARGIIEKPDLSLEEEQYLKSIDVDIPDPVLRRAIQNVLGTKKINGLDALSLRSLVYMGGPLKVKNLTGMSAFKNLNKLTLYNNKISGTDGLEDLPNLTALDLVQNELEDTRSLSCLTSLESLNLERNKIADLSGLASLSRLKYVNLASNGIKDLHELSELYDLEYLNVNENQLKDISVLSGLTNLTTLYLGGNYLNDISGLSGLLHLSTLDLGDNALSDISALSELENLDFLSLTDNSLTEIGAISNLKKLAYLSLSNNKLSDISALSGLTNLETLILSWNKFSDLSPLRDLTKMKVLYLTSTDVADLQPLSQLTEIEILSLAFTDVDDLLPLSSMAKLTTLNLSSTSAGERYSANKIRRLLNSTNDLDVLY